MRKNINRWIVIIAACFIFACDVLPLSQSTPTPTNDTILEAKVSNVFYRPSGASQQVVDKGERLLARTGDGVNVDPGGEALLSFGDYLQVRIFRDSNLSIESQIDPNAPPVARVRLSSGTTFNTASSQALAGQRVQISTDYATIVATGTEYFVHYDAATQETWVIDESGTVEVTANGVTVAVPAHWQTWVEPNASPAPIVPAHRLAVGNRFELIDVLTNGAMKDTDLLGDAIAQCTTNAETQLLATATTGAEVVKVIAANSMFVPVSQTVVASGDVWLNGLDATSAQGWVPASVVTCGIDINLLAQVNVPPTPIFTPTASPSMTVTPTLQVGVTPTLKPSPTRTPTLKPSPTGTPAPIISTIYVGTNDGGGYAPGTVYKNTSGSGNWIAVNPGLTSYGVHISHLVIDPQSPNTLYAGTDGGVFKSTNAGGTWSAMNSGLSNTSLVTPLAINPQNSKILYVGTRGDVFKSTNAGATWGALNSGLTNTVTALVINPQNPNTLYAIDGSTVGVFRSTNGGGTWSMLNSGIPNTIYAFDALAIDPQNPGTLYAGTTGIGGVLKSINGGSSWNVVMYSSIVSSSGMIVHALAIDPKNSNVVYAGTEYGVFKSKDGGGTWSKQTSGLTNLQINSIAIDPRNTNTLYVGTPGGVFKSTNAGGTWSAMNAGLTYTQITALAITP